MKNSMLFIGVWVLNGSVCAQIAGIKGNNVYFAKGVPYCANTYIRPIPYAPEWADNVMPEGWHRHLAICKVSQRPGWWLEAKGTDLYFEFVHELQLLVAALRLEEEITMLNRNSHE